MAVTFTEKMAHRCLLPVALREEWEAGVITLHEAGRELCKHGWYNFVPDDSKTLEILNKYQ